MTRSSASSARSSSRRGVVPAERLEALFAVQREKGVDLARSRSCNANVVDEIAIAQRARRRGASSRSSSGSTSTQIATALATRVPITFAKAHRILVVRRGRARGPRRLRRSVRHAARSTTCARSSASRSRRSSAAGDADRGRHQPRLRARGRRRASSRATTRSVDEEAASDILDSDDDAPVIRWVNSLFLQAMKERASDIHIEPEEKEVIVRYRIDGELYVARRAPRAVHEQHRRRVKIKSALNIAEKRLPQDGRITQKIAGKSFDIRVTTIPTSRGYERIVMRLLNKSSVLLDLPDLGFARATTRSMDALIHRPDGIILVTGPTGSGKTTTLYACLNRINQPEHQHPHRRGSGRVRDRRHPPGARAAEDRAHLRERAARLPPPRSGRHHGRRDPRQGDGRDRDQRVAHRSPRALHDPHERRGRRRHAPGRHGHRAVPRALVASSASSRSASCACSARTARSRTRPTDFELEELGLTAGAHRAPRRSAARSADVALLPAHRRRAATSLELDPAQRPTFYKAEGLRPVRATRASSAAAASTSSSDRRRRRPARPRRAPTRRPSSAPRMEQGMDTPARRRRAQGARRA